MFRSTRLLLPVALLAIAPAAVHAQQPEQVRAGTPALQTLLMRSPGPLAIAALSTDEAGWISVEATGMPPAPAMQYYRPDWEFGRAWLGAVIGTGLAYTFDLIVHYESDFSKGNMFLNEKGSGGEVTYNILLYSGLAPYYAMKGVYGVTPYSGNRWGGFAGGVVGSLLGLAYWTDRGEVQDAAGMIVMTGLTALGAQIGYHLFK